MYQDDNWNPVEGDELEGFIEQVTPIDGRHKVTAESSEVHWRTLPFYDNVAMIRVQDSSWDKPGLVVYYLTREGQLYRLNGTSPPIHEINDVAPVKITEDNVLDYLEFFCFFVRTEEGPFLVVEDMNNPYLPESLDESSLKAIEGVIMPKSYEGVQAKDEKFGDNSEMQTIVHKGAFLCKAVVYYSSSLFISSFAVYHHNMPKRKLDDFNGPIAGPGMIVMYDDDELIESLPAKVDAPVS